MKYLEPKRIRVNSMMVVSHQIDNADEDDKTIKERRVFIGYFDDKVSAREIEIALTKNDLWAKVSTLDSVYGDEFKAVSSVSRLITEGIVFDNADEFVQYLKTGLLYDDILEGYLMAKLTGEKDA